MFCRSAMGKKGGKQIVRVGGCKTDGVISWGRICHELMHVVGSFNLNLNDYRLDRILLFKHSFFKLKI